MIEKVCERMRKRGLQLDIDDRLKAHSKKRKFLVKSLPDEKVATVTVSLNILPHALVWCVIGVSSSSRL